MVNSCSIRVNIEDVHAMRTICKELFLKDNPKMRGLKLTDRFMFKKVIEYYQKSVF